MDDPTIGQVRMLGPTIAPPPDVDLIRQKAAELIDLIDELPLPEQTVPLAEGGARGEARRLKSLAMTAIEEGSMWAVKAATRG